MTEGPLVRNDKPMCVRIWLEVGHVCKPRRPALGRSLALDWDVWVQGIGGQDISAFVHKVVFHLHPSSAFFYPKRVLQEPPYKIHESGCSSIEIPINVYLKYSKKPKKIRLKYRLQIENINQSSSETSRIFYDLENPSEQLWTSIMKCGGEIIAHAGSFTRGGDKLVMVLSERDSGKERHKNNKHSSSTKKCKFIKPIKCKHGTKRDTASYFVEDICSKYSDPGDHFKKLLRSVEMTDDEINQVSQLYLSLSSYEKSPDALLLPPLSDPIYRLPELPMSLRSALSDIDMDSDYVIQ